MNNKSLYISIVSIFVTIIFSHLQLSYASSNSDFRLEDKRVKQSAISFQTFKKEFIFTNSAEDFYRSFKRLIYKYNIGIPEEKLPEILLAPTESEKDFVKYAVSNLAYEANEYSYYRDNNYYITLNKIVKKLIKLNIAAALEIALVNDYKKKASELSHIMKLSSNVSRYLYLINHARFEIMSVTLHHKRKIN